MGFDLCGRVVHSRREIQCGVKNFSRVGESKFDTSVLLHRCLLFRFKMWSGNDLY